jgi:hypothetical protein
MFVNNYKYKDQAFFIHRSYVDVMDPDASGRIA